MPTLMPHPDLLTAPTGLPPTDADLLGRFLADRTEAAFETIVDRHGPLVLRACRRVLGRTPEAEDAFQATFLVLAERAPRFGTGPRSGAGCSASPTGSPARPGGGRPGRTPAAPRGPGHDPR